MKTIDWQEKTHNELIHGLVDGEVVIRMKREIDPPFIWNMTGLVEGRSQYRNDLKERAEIHLKLQKK